MRELGRRTADSDRVSNPDRTCRLLPGLARTSEAKGGRLRTRAAAPPGPTDQRIGGAESLRAPRSGTGWSAIPCEPNRIANSRFSPDIAPRPVEYSVSNVGGRGGNMKDRLGRFALLGGAL